jgi:hypothetical protein
MRRRRTSPFSAGDYKDPEVAANVARLYLSVLQGQVLGAALDAGDLAFTDMPRLLPRARSRRSAQASLCRACKSLERRGLVTRHGRGIRLTDLGLMLATRRRNYLAGLADFYRGVNTFHAGGTSVNEERG